MRDAKRLIHLAGLTLLAGLVFASCGYRPEGAAAESAAPAQTSEPAEATALPAGTTLFTVTYQADGAVLYTESVAEGACPLAATDPDCGDAAFAGWADGTGKMVDVTQVPVTADVTYTAVTGPGVVRDKAYFAPRDDGLFHPDEAFTRSDAARAVYAVLRTKPAGETFLGDVTTRAQCYQAATTLVTAGYMQLTGNGDFLPDTAISTADLTSLLTHIFAPNRVREALSGAGESITRGQAAVALNALLGIADVSGGAYFPDVAPSDAAFGAVSAAGVSGGVTWGTGDGLPAAGYVNVDGYLYRFGDDGYFLKDQYEGTLYFGPDGRFTSGNESLDGYVADIVDSQTDASMSRDEMLRAVYEYVRDHYLYLKRNYYEIGETGWEIDEALLMFQSGKGNCYNFTGAFWALARGVGFDASCVSGLVGVGRDPHSWVEISFDGTPYIFDVETEMSCRLQNDYSTSLYKMTYAQGEFWSYAREPYPDGTAAAG